MRLWSSITTLGLVAVLALAGGAFAQQQQVIATLDGEVTKAPDELPGTYQANVTVTVEVAGGACLCQETTVTLVGDGPGDELSFDPSSYTIDWTEKKAAGEPGADEQSVDVEIPAPESDSEMHPRIDTELEHSPSTHIASNTNPTQLELVPPSSDDDGEDLEQASAQDEGDDESGVPGLAAGATALVVATAALIRRAG